MVALTLRLCALVASLAAMAPSSALAQADRTAARGFFPLDHADQAGLREAAVHLDAPCRQPVGDQLRGAAFLEGELGMGVDVAPDAAQLGVIAADLLDGRMQLVGGCVHGISR